MRFACNMSHANHWKRRMPVNNRSMFTMQNSSTSFQFVGMVLLFLCFSFYHNPGTIEGHIESCFELDPHSCRALEGVSTNIENWRLDLRLRSPYSFEPTLWGVETASRSDAGIPSRLRSLLLHSPSNGYKWAHMNSCPESGITQR